MDIFRMFYSENYLIVQFEKKASKSYSKETITVEIGLLDSISKARFQAKTI